MRSGSRGPGRRHPLKLASQDAGLRRSSMRSWLRTFAIADVEGLVFHQHPDELSVGHVDDRLPGLGEAVARLCVGQRPHLVPEAAQVGARQARRLALIEVPAQPYVSIAQREDRLRLC